MVNRFQCVAFCWDTVPAAIRWFRSSVSQCPSLFPMKHSEKTLNGNQDNAQTHIGGENILLQFVDEVSGHCFSKHDDAMPFLRAG